MCRTVNSFSERQPHTQKRQDDDCDSVGSFHQRLLRRFTSRSVPTAHEYRCRVARLLDRRPESGAAPPCGADAQRARTASPPSFSGRARARAVVNLTMRSLYVHNALATLTHAPRAKFTTPWRGATAG